MSVGYTGTVPLVPLSNQATDLKTGALVATLPCSIMWSVLGLVCPVSVYGDSDTKFDQQNLSVWQHVKVFKQIRS